MVGLSPLIRCRVRGAPAGPWRIEELGASREIPWKHAGRCNSYGGKYTASGSSFAIQELRWTEAGCPSHELFLQESLYTDLPVHAEAFALSGSRLTITSADGQAMTFAPRAESP